MKTLIIYKSYHRKNTEKIAKVMAEALSAKLVKVNDVKPEELANYDLIGFGPGIYGLKHHKTLVEFVDKMPMMDKNVFIFSTTGNFRDVHHKLLREKLAGKGCKIVGEFTCKGEYTLTGSFVNLPDALGFAGVLIGGLNKGHPDQKDLENAKAFAKSLEIKH